MNRRTIPGSSPARAPINASATVSTASSISLPYLPRKPRRIEGGTIYHVLNRDNGRRMLFNKEADFAAFIKLLGDAVERFERGIRTQPVGLGTETTIALYSSFQTRDSR